METPFYLLVIRYNFRNRTREKAPDLLKAAQPPGNMKAHGAIFARGARARRPTPERSGFHDKNSHCPMLFHALGRVYFLPCLHRAKRLMRLYPETTGAGVALFCRRCKRELVVDIQPGTSPDRVTLREINAAAG